MTHELWYFVGFTILVYPSRIKKNGPWPSDNDEQKYQHTKIIPKLPRYTKCDSEKILNDAGFSSLSEAP